MNNTLCEYTLEDLTTENLLDVLKEWKGSVPLLPFISTNSEGGFAMFYKQGEEGEEYQNKIIQKFKGFGDYLLNKAKEENIYCKDYEEKIQKYYEEGNLIFLSVEVGRLADRIIISTDNEKTLPASKRALELKEPNGQIDEAYVQGYTGDCWFIGALASICADKNAHDRLNQMITVNKENDEIKSVTVNIQGNEYQIDYEELKNANEYATGDLDIRAVEIALNRYLHDNELGDLDLGGDVIDGYKYLFGEENIIVNDFKNKKEADESEYMTIKNNDDYENQFNANEYIEEIKKHVNGAISTIGIYKNGTYEDNTPKFAIDKDGKKVELKAHHAYTYTRIDSEYYYFKDTHDLQNELKIKIDDFAKTFECGTIVELI
jgi:predicted  nucleic acid-binding Zn-ribbon protein